MNKTDKELHHGTTFSQVSYQIVLKKIISDFKTSALSIIVNADDNGSYLIELLGELNKLLVSSASAWQS